jgi:hypothetical protein
MSLVSVCPEEYSHITGFCEGEAYHGARSNTVTLSIPKGERNGEHKADLHTGEVLSTRLPSEHDTYVGSDRGGKKKLTNLKEILEENEQLELEAKLASLYLPSRDAIEKILRYETAIERQLYRAMSQLERLQRQRQGDLVPPPISVDLSNPN